MNTTNFSYNCIISKFIKSTKCLCAYQRRYCTASLKKVRSCSFPTSIFGGATAVGKSKLACELQSRLNGLLINGDATKVYKGLDIGANKTSIQKSSPGMRIIDIVDPFDLNANFSAAQYCSEIYPLLHSALSNEKKLPIIVGGSGFYLKWLIHGPASSPRRDLNAYEAIYNELKGLGWSKVVEKLSQYDPMYAKALVHNDYRRAARAMEVMTTTGRPMSDFKVWNQFESLMQESSNDRISELRKELKEFQNFDFRTFLLTRPRIDVYHDISHRCDRMIMDGLFLEVWNLMKQGLTVEHAAGKSVGYRQTIDFLSKRDFTIESFFNYLRKFQTKTRQLAHKQWIWFRAEPEFVPVNISNPKSAADSITHYCSIDFESWKTLINNRSQEIGDQPFVNQEEDLLRKFEPPEGLFFPKGNNLVLHRFMPAAYPALEIQLKILGNIKQEMDSTDFPNRIPYLLRLFEAACDVIQQRSHAVSAKSSFRYDNQWY